jgi:endonuclease YncB( thermonuclease family)
LKILIYRPAVALIFLIFIATAAIGLDNTQFNDSSALPSNASFDMDYSGNTYPPYDQYAVGKIAAANSAEIAINGVNTPVKLIGVVAWQNTKDKQQDACYQKLSSSRLGGYIKNKRVELEGDDSVLDKNRDNALLRYIRLDASNINEEMVASGYAKASAGITNYKYRSEFLAAQAQAQHDKLGFWSGTLCPSTIVKTPVSQSAGSLSYPTQSSSRVSSPTKNSSSKTSRNNDDKQSSETPGGHGGGTTSNQNCKGLPIIGGLLNGLLGC